MTITREILEARMAELIASRQQLLDNANAHNGAISECQRMLQTLNEASGNGMAPRLAMLENAET